MQTYCSHLMCTIYLKTAPRKLASHPFCRVPPSLDWKGITRKHGGGALPNIDTFSSSIQSPKMDRMEENEFPIKQSWIKNVHLQAEDTTANIELYQYTAYLAFYDRVDSFIKIKFSAHT
jgi:hypothetical protein